MSDEEDLRGGYVEKGGSVVASKLAAQLGTDLVDLGKARFDMRRLSIIQEADVGLLLYAKIKSRKSRVWKTIYEELLNLKVSINGRGRRDIIRMEAVSQGGTADVESEIIKPGALARNIYDRNWEDKQRSAKGM